MKNTICKALSVIIISVLVLASITGCENEKKTLTWVWYPNESTPEKSEARAELIRIAEETLGVEIEEKTTTDYNIAIEALVNDNAAFSWLGGEGYTQAHEKNPAILPMVVDSGKSGTLKDAKYYSMLGVLIENADEHKKNGVWTYDNLEQKDFSFVSNSSTSGFRIPSSVISDYFGKTGKYKGMTSKDLLEGGSDKLFSKVMYGGSHQGSMLNMLSGKSEVSAFCNSCVQAYVEWVEGSIDDPLAGDVVVIKEGAAAPFDEYEGMEFTFISTTPVLNAPLVMNTNLLTDEQSETLIDVLTSDEVANNKKIFVPKDSSFTGLGFNEGVRFVEVEDSWYDPIRKLSGLK